MRKSQNLAGQTTVQNYWRKVDWEAGEARIAAEARRESEEASIEKGNPGNERYISNVLQEIEDGTSQITRTDAPLEE